MKVVITKRKYFKKRTQEFYLLMYRSAISERESITATVIEKLSRVGSKPWDYERAYHIVSRKIKRLEKILNRLYCGY